jgi:hypothetical protein
MPTSTPLWPTLKQVLRRQELMDRMMRMSGVDVVTAVRVDGGLAFVEARAKCRYCLHEEACQDWLESSEEPRMPPDFCPNASFFHACRAKTAEPADAPLPHE